MVSPPYKEHSCSGKSSKTSFKTCKKLGWPDLSARRDYLSLIECYKIVFGITDNLNFGDLFEKSKSSRTRANHRYKLYVKMAKVNSYNI